MDAKAVLALIATILLIANFIAVVWKGAARVRDFYLATLGERRFLYRKLARLTPGAQIGRFTEILGVPVFKNPNDATDEFIYAHRYFYVQAVATKEGKVVVYAVTARTSKFNPPIWPQNLKPTTSPLPPNNSLGISFADLGQQPWLVAGFLGARRFHYMEIHYFGNPAHYQYWGVAINDSASADAPLEMLQQVFQDTSCVWGRRTPRRYGLISVGRM